MTCYFVSRHQGAKDWARAEGVEATIVEHLDVTQIRPGDRVWGTLPVHLAAEVCARGARFFHLEMRVPQDLRGHSLTAAQMREIGARLVEYSVVTRGSHVDEREG